MVAEVRQKLAVSKETRHKFYIEGFSLKKLKETEDKDEYWVEISNRLGALVN
jgi:hypothetical protein